MCGIVGYIGKLDAVEVAIKALKELEYRGYDSAGLAFLDKDKTIRLVKSVGRVSALEQKAKTDPHNPGNSSLSLGHTRWATHGEASEINCHPHRYGKVTLIHNGIIENYREVAAVLEEEGICPKSQTDSEIAAMLLGSRYNGNPIRTLTQCLPLLTGSYAFGIIFDDHPDKLYAARMGSPLVAAEFEQGAILASDVLAISSYTREYYSLPEKSIAVLSEVGLSFYNYKGRKINLKKDLLSWDTESAKKQGYEYFMQKEIHEEPEALERTVAPRIIEGMPDFSADAVSDSIFSNINEIVITACGTAYHAGLVARHWFEHFLRLNTRVEIASEFRYQNPLVDKNTLVIVISQSGETADTLAALRLAREKGCRTLGVVNVKGSTIAREAECVLYTHAGPEIAVASTKAFSVQLSVLFLIMLRMADLYKKLEADEIKRMCSELRAVSEGIVEILKRESEIKKDCFDLIETQDLFFIGRGLDFALSMEGSIKLKEISYIHSEAYAAGELKHGTISLITEGVPVIAIATQPKLFEKMVSNIREVKSRGAKVILISASGFPEDAELYDSRFDIPDVNSYLTPFLCAVYLQLIAYYASYGKGLDVDHPRNLAKSVTVE